MVKLRVLVRKKSTKVLGFTLPREIVRKGNLEEGRLYEVTLEGERIVFTPVRRPPVGGG